LPVQADWLFLQIIICSAQISKHIKVGFSFTAILVGACHFICFCFARFHVAICITPAGLGNRVGIPVQKAGTKDRLLSFFIAAFFLYLGNTALFTGSNMAGETSGR